MPGATETVFVVFGLIAVGYGARRLNLVPESAGDGLAAFVFAVAVPVLLFRTLAEAEFGGFSPWGLWAAYFGGVAIAWSLGHALVARLFGRDARAGTVAGVSAAFANTVMVGIPLVQSAFPPAGMAVLLVLISVHLPVMFGASLFLSGIAARIDGAGTGDAKAGARRFLAGLSRNPIVLGIIAGALWRAIGLPLSGVPGRVVEAIAGIAGPAALIASGVGLARYGFRGNVRPALGLTVIKLLVMPAAVLGLGLSLGLPPLVVGVATAVAACPTGVNAYLIATEVGTGQALASNAMTASTLFGAATLSLWLPVIARLA